MKRLYVILVYLVPSICLSAEITTGTCNDADACIYLKGEIKGPDSNKFSEIARTLNRGTVAVHLESPGGYPVAAEEIGQAIHKHSWSTVADSACNSACSLIWLAGNKKASIASNGQCVFHAPFRITNPGRISDPHLNVIQYLYKAGYSKSYVQTLTMEENR